MKSKCVFLVAILTAVLCFSGNLLAYSGDGDGSAGSPYQISSVTDWQQLMGTSADWSKSFILTADIDLAGVTLTPVGNTTTSFMGILDGDNHIIRNVSMNAPAIDSIGLFGHVSSLTFVVSGVIKNLGVESANITGRWYVGALAGQNYGVIINCHATGTVSGGERYVGGLVGCNVPKEPMTHCYTTCDVIGTANSYCVGGLIGTGGGAINCYATGNVSCGPYSQMIGGRGGRGREVDGGRRGRWRECSQLLRNRRGQRRAIFARHRGFDWVV